MRMVRAVAWMMISKLRCWLCVWDSNKLVQNLFPPQIFLSGSFILMQASNLLKAQVVWVVSWSMRKTQVGAWLGFPLDAPTCAKLGSQEKVTVIYELELLAAVIALNSWSGCHGDELNVHFGDSEGVRFSLVKASATGLVGQGLMAYHLKLESIKRVSNMVCSCSDRMLAERLSFWRHVHTPYWWMTAM